MNLLGDGALWVARACVVLALVGGTAAASFSFRRRIWTILKNLVVVTVSSLLMVAGIGLTLNQQNGWYPTLDDVLGRQPSSVAAVTVGAENAKVLFGKDTVDTTDTRTLAALPSPGQRVQHFHVPTGHGHTWDVDVVLPEGYFDAANAHRAYPVAMLLHGVPGAVSAWEASGRMSVDQLLQPLVTQKKVAPFIAVIPEVTPSGLDTECELGPSTPTETEDWLVGPVVQLVRSRTRAITSRAGWVTAGYSAGGWCSAFLTLQHPDLFGAGVVLGGYFEPWWGATKPKWAAGSAGARRLDLVQLVHAARPKVGLYVQSTRDDTSSWNTTRRFLAKVKSPTMVEAEVLPHGGHTFGIWKGGLVHAFTWIGRTVPGFKP